MKTIPKHPLPPTPNQIIGLIDEAIVKYKFDKIFLITDELNYLNLFKKSIKKFYVTETVLDQINLKYLI